MMYKELKAEIINWLMENGTVWQRVNKCHEVFRQYIYGADGNYIIGGKDVSNFICAADKLIYGNSVMVEIISEISEYK